MKKMGEGKCGGTAKAHGGSTYRQPKVQKEPKTGSVVLKNQRGFKLPGQMGKCNCSKGTSDLTYGAAGVSSAKPGNRYSRGVKVPKGMGGGNGGGKFKSFPKR